MAIPSKDTCICAQKKYWLPKTATLAVEMFGWTPASSMHTMLAPGGIYNKKCKPGCAGHLCYAFKHSDSGQLEAFYCNSSDEPGPSFLSPAAWPTSGPNN